MQRLFFKRKVPTGFFYMLEKYTNVVFLALFTFLMAKIISTEDFGVISNADAIIAIISIFSFQGLEQLVQREIVNEQKDEPNIIGAALLFKIPGIILGLIIAWIWSMWIDDSRLSACILIFSGLIIARSLTFFSSSFIAKDKYLIFTLIGICTYVLFFFIKMFVLYYVPSLFYIAIVTVTENLFLIVLYYIYGCDKVSFTNKLVKKYIKVFYYEGFYLILSGAMVVIYTKTDQLYIAKFMSYTILANYAIALKFLMLYIVPSSIFTLSFVPKLNKNNKEYAKNVRVMLLGSLIFGVAFACICAMTTPFFDRINVWRKI